MEVVRCFFLSFFLAMDEGLTFSYVRAPLWLQRETQTNSLYALTYTNKNLSRHGTSIRNVNLVTITLWDTSFDFNKHLETPRLGRHARRIPDKQRGHTSEHL